IDDDRRVAGLLGIAEAEEERSAAKRRRYVAGGPLPIAQKKILAAIEPKDRNRLELAIGIPAEQDGIFTLELLELTRHDQCLVDCNAFRRCPLVDAELRMFDIVERRV